MMRFLTTIILTMAISVCFACLVTGCVESTNSDSSKIVKEQKLNDSGVPRFDAIDVIVLPTGERVLVMSGPNGLSACCLLPPLQTPKVEK